MKEIKPSLKALLNLSEDQLSAISALTGKVIFETSAPLIGRYIIVDGKPICGIEPNHKDLEFAYERSSTGEYTRVYIGASHTGPLVSWCEEGWANLYGHGNHGKNGACGGTWSSESMSMPNRHKTLSDCLKNRNYKVCGLTMHKSRLKEGPALIEALESLCKGE